jgi:Tfp pilus assembly PilM family ATPase
MRGPIVSKRAQILSLDVGHDLVKAATAVRRGSHVVITRTATLRLPAGGADRAGIIGRWLQEQGLTGNRCTIALSGQQVIFQPMFMVQGDPRSIEQAAAMELVKMRDLAAEDMVHGFAPFASNPGEQRVLLAMARPSVLDETTALVRQLGLELLDIVPAPVALFNALVGTVEAQDAPSVFMHVGHSATEVAIGSRHGMMFARSFAGGGQLFTDALSRARQLPGPHAESMKVGGSCSLTTGDPADVKTLTRAADVWIAECQSCLAVYNSLFPNAKDRATRIILSGGGALLGGLADFVAAKTGLPTTLIARIPAHGAPEPQAVWTITAGLLTGALRAPRCTISLVPRAIRDEWMFRRQKPFWIAAGLVALVILAVGLVGGWYDSARMQRHLREQRTSLERRRSLVEQIEAAKARNDDLRAQVSPVTEMLRAGPLMRQVMALVAQSKAPKDWIVLFCDADSYYEKKEPASRARSPDAARLDRRRLPSAVTVAETGTNAPPLMQHIIIEGYTLQPSFATVQKLLDRLEASDLVASADLLSDDKLVQPETQPDLPDGKAKRFVIDIKMANQ